MLLQVGGGIFGWKQAGCWQAEVALSHSPAPTLTPLSRLIMHLAQLFNVVESLVACSTPGLLGDVQSCLHLFSGSE